MMKRFLLFFASFLSSSSQVISQKFYVFLYFLKSGLAICRDLFSRFILTYCLSRLRGICPLIANQVSSSLVILALVTPFLLFHTAKAGEFKDLEKFYNWEIEQYNEDSIVISTYGEIIYGDTLFFRIVKKDCNSIEQLFTLYTTSNHEKINTLKNKILSITDNGVQQNARVIYVKPAMSGHIITFDMGSFQKEEIIRYYTTYQRFQMSILDIHQLEDVGSFKAKDFFDIPVNFWNTPYIDDALTIGQAYCKQLGNNLHAHYERI
jgi:hypothetical protein